ncbi:MAG: hypothetical protein U1F43_28170 [Myxococcota bacterium]
MESNSGTPTERADAKPAPAAPPAAAQPMSAVRAAIIARAKKKALPKTPPKAGCKPQELDFEAGPRSGISRRSG